MRGFVSFLDKYARALIRAHTTKHTCTCAHTHKDLGDMLEILTDPFKRQLYDEGYDKKAIEERVEAAQRAAREPQRGHHHH